MPSALLRSCTTHGCGGLSTHGACDKCRAEKQRAYDERRGSAASRGYDRRWSAYSKWFLSKWRFCGQRPHDAPQTSDSRCQADNLLTPATVTDHIVPVTGPTDPTFFKTIGKQALCETCHNAKRQREARAALGAMR